MADTDQTGIPYSQYAAAYRKVYGAAPSLEPGYAEYYAQHPDATYNPKFGAQGQIPLSTLMAIAGAPGQAQTGSSYLGSDGGSNMTWQQVGQQLGLSPSDINFYTQKGYTPDQILSSFQRSGGGPSGAADTASSQTGAAGPQDAFGVTRTDSGKGYVTLKTASGQTVNQDSAGNYFTTDDQGNNTPVSDAQAQQMGFQSAIPEAQSLKQLQQIDPTSEKLRSSLGQSYADQLSQAQDPTAAQYQSYLDLLKQVDPQEYAQRQGMASSMDSYLKSAQDQAALGSQLDPVSRMQVEQAARKAQAARGNLYGSGQAAVEAMTTGQAGEALRQQRQQALGSALGQQQGYLSAGLGLGDTAMQLYQQGLANKANAMQGGMSYLSSGQTPYQAGASYLANAEGAAANAAQGGPQYNPASLGTSYSGSAQSAPQYGLDIGAQSQNYFNSLNNAYGGGGGATKNRNAAAMTGAASGAISGGMSGAAIGGPYAPVTGAVGAIAGGLIGGASGYYS